MYNYGGYQYPYYQNGAMPDTLGQYKMQYAQQPTQGQTAQYDQSPKNVMLWVLNENEATSYPVAPNNSVVLWDKLNPTIYVKSANTQGVPSMRILDFVERGAESTETNGNATKTHECTCGDKFITKQEYRKIEAKLTELEQFVDELKEKQKETALKSTKVKGE